MLRIKTGIQGLDKALKEGIPEGNLVLLSGGAGTGKSTISMQFLINGAKTFGERGLYISTEQSEEELQKAASQFGWNLVDLENRNLLRVVYFKVLGEDHFIQRIEELVKVFKPKRIVVDSLSTFTDALLMSELQKDVSVSMVKIADTVSPVPRTEQIMTKIILYNLLGKLKEFDSTILMTSELQEETKKLSSDGVSEFISDGVITLHYLEGTNFRTIKIHKMRYTSHDSHTIDYVISEKGIETQESVSTDKL